MEQFVESRSFKKNPVHWSMFYASTFATLVMFIILCALSSWSIHIARQVSEILSDVDILIPEIRNSLSLLEFMCKSENFTKNYGVCPF
jgi:hypothetical protein